jgi:hypothetical protein
MSQSHINSQEGGAAGAQIFSLAKAREERKMQDVYARWVAYYGKQEHQDLLDALVYEHENNFPLRSSEDPLDHLRHKALIQVLQERAHSDFLKNLLSEIRSE